jgi:hypothetical protein
MSMPGWWFGSSSSRLKARLAVLPLVAITGFTLWMLLPKASDAESRKGATPTDASRLAQSASGTEGAAVSAPAILISPAQSLELDDGRPAKAAASPLDISPPATTEAAKSPIDGLKISSQSWRRGGLGSKALVTFTLRNGNDYAVKDIEIACAFTRRDGSHLTDRRRVITDTVKMKSRKRYAGLLVGFVNVNASKAKCSLVAASRV